MTHPRDDRWQHLVSGAFRLDETPPEKLESEALVVLRSVLEVFPPGEDPLDDFEAYAVRRLASSMLRVLEARR